MDRKIIHTNSSVSVDVFHYKSDDSYTDVEKFEIDGVIGLTTAKDIASPSGTFNIKITPTQNWKKRIRNGDWVLIYFSNGEEKRLKFLGNVDRVSRVVDVDSDGTASIKYSVSGRDFGKVFEKTNIYYDPTSPQAAQINVNLLKKNILFAGSPDKIVSDIIDVFLGKDIETLESLNQWLIPQKLAKEIKKKNVNPAKKSGTSFYDVLTKKLDSTLGYKAYESIDSVHGYLWNLLKMNSNEPINELFLELHHDKETNQVLPTIFLRMIPFTDEDYSIESSKVGSVNRFIDLDRVSITDENIIYEDVGESDHVKFNFFLLTVAGEPFFNRVISTSAAAGGDFPKIDANSIKKYGLLTRIDNTDFAFLSGKEEVGISAIDILNGWNNLLAHWYENAHKLESGTMKINGNLDVEIGKVLEVEYTKFGNNDKYLYYIEGYENEWEYPGLWTTSLKLTRGRKENKQRKIIEDSNDTDKQYVGTSNIVR